MPRSVFEIIIPPEHSSTNSDHLYIVGKTDAPAVSVKINNKNSQVVSVKDSIFHFYAEFGYGLNEIFLNPLYDFSGQSNVDTVILDILSSPNISKKYEKIFIDYDFHDNITKLECVKCHTYESENPDIMEKVEPCLKCHEEIEDSFEKHVKDKEGACVICHKIKQDLTSYNVDLNAVGNPCYFCHKDKIGQFKQDFIHGPVAGGSCTICHNAHGSEFEYNLKSSEIVLCSSCHTTVEENWDRKIQHHPFKYGHCGDCHDPHSTNNKWVLVKSSPEVCVGCHKEDGLKSFHKHPFNVEPKKELVRSLKLSSSGQLECISCHYPHASDTEHLLRVKGTVTCMECHSDR
jgi:predicted CXXCH cytochrome family protein